MNIYKCKIKRIVHETHFEYMAAPNITLAKDRDWLKNAKEMDIEFLTEPDKEWETVTVQKASKVDKFEDLPSHWLDSHPWFHPQHVPIDRDATMKDYFKVTNVNYSKIIAIESHIRDMEYEIMCRQNRITELEKELKSLKK